jgi:hypothetical protein
MASIETLLENIRALEPDEIRARLEAMENEEKALRVLLRTKLAASKAASSKTAKNQGGDR